MYFRVTMKPVAISLSLLLLVTVGSCLVILKKNQYIRKV